MFATTAPNPENFLQLWLSLALIAAVVGPIITFMLGRRMQKREVHFGFEPASKVEFEKHIEWNRREHENLYSKLSCAERGLSTRCDNRHEVLEKEHKEELRRIHNRIDAVLTAVSTVHGKLEQFNLDNQKRS